MSITPLTLEARVARYGAPRIVQVDGPCQLWTGAVATSGYGTMGGGPNKRYAHRVAFEQVRGAIPPNVVVDHLCRNRLCVNPDHMELVTPRENARRGATGYYSDRCGTGRHEKVPNYRVKPNGMGYCAACNREYCAGRRAGLQ